jgi:chemotaxis protein CheX
MELLEIYAKPFVKATLNTFKTFAGFDLIVGNPHFSGRTRAFQQDIAAIIGFSGDIRGAVVIAMKKDLIIKLADTLTRVPHSQIDDDAVDAIGEIVNIIAGNIKREVPNGEKIEISLPTVIKGSGTSFSWPGRQSRTLCISFKYKEDTFHLLVDMEKERVKVQTEDVAKSRVIPEWIEWGKEQEKRVIAQNLLNTGMSVEQIAQITEWPVEKVQDLVNYRSSQHNQPSVVHK